MATISRAHLAITPDDYARTTQVRVTCQVAYTDEEVAVMSQRQGPLYFTLFCWLLGKDKAPAGLSFLNPDDWIYWFQSQPLPQAGPAQQEIVRFEATLGHDLLDEDVIGEDEIIAQLMLRGWKTFKGFETTAESNTIQYQFG